MLSVMFANKLTTIIGIVAAFVSYLASQGTNLPTDRAGWGALLVAAALAALGITAKDATTGSAPGDRPNFLRR